MPIFDRRTARSLAGVHPELIAVVREAIRRAQPPAPRIVAIEGIRTEAMHQAIVATAGSRSVRSPHLIQPDGYGHAVRLAVIVRNEIRYEVAFAFGIADAVRSAAFALGVGIKWGWVWAPMATLPDLIDDRVTPKGWPDAACFMLFNR